MTTRRGFLKGGIAGSAALLLSPRLAISASPLDVTFLVANDVHACLMGSRYSPNCVAEGKTDENLLKNIRALNAVQRHRWPDTVNGKPSGLSVAGQPIARPQGLVVCGDLTDDGGGQTAEPEEGSQLRQFASRYRQGKGPGRVHVPVYVGLGNHDLDQDGRPPQLDWYRDELRDYVRLNHKPGVFSQVPLPADNYDEVSDNYSWNWNRLHLIQAQRFAGDTAHGQANSLAWLARDLETFASDGRPVVIFQHYGWDPFSTERWDPVAKTFDDAGSGAPHWWSDAERHAFFDAIAGYNVIAIFHGHQHESPMIYKESGIDVIKPTAAFMGGFGLVRVTDKTMDVALCKADDTGGITFLQTMGKTI